MSSENVLVTGSYDHTIKFWSTDKSTWEKKFSLPIQNEIVNRMTISPNKKTLLCGCTNSLKIFDLDDNSSFSLKHSYAYNCNVTCVGYKRDSEWLFAGSEDGLVKIFDPRLDKSQTLNIPKKNPGAAINSIVLSPIQSDIITGDQDGNIIIYDLVAGKTKYEFCPDKKHSITWLNISYNPTYLIASNSGGGIWIAKYDKDSRDIVSTTDPNDLIKAHDGYILQSSISHDVKTLATCSADRTMKLWKITNEAPYIRQENILYGHTGWVWDSAF